MFSNFFLDQSLETASLLPLQIACERYYYKPYAAFFNAFHLRAFQSLGLDMGKDILDVGSFEGSYGCLLAEMLGQPTSMVGLELNPDAIARATPQAREVYTEMIQGNANEMPFPDNRFDTVFFLASLVSILPDPATALKEAFRVLRPGGTLIVTVSTKEFQSRYWQPRMFQALGLPALAERARASMNHRMIQFHSYSFDEWKALIQNTGFTQADGFGFFPLSQAGFWSLLAWGPLRIFGGLTLLPFPRLHRLFSHLYHKGFQNSFQHTPRMLDPDQSAYVLIQTHKPNDMKEVR